jgi:uncharacterized protein (DUF362 family)
MIPADLKQVIKPTHKILVDLNLLLDEDYELGNITDPRTTEGVVDFLVNELEIPGENIWVGDGGYASATPGAIKRLKLPEMSVKYGFHVIDINRDIEIKNVPVPNPISMRKISVSKIAMDVDVIISVPSLKTHSMAVTTLSIKNLMGIIFNRSNLHSNIHQKLADLYSVFQPKTKLAVIDGFIGSDGMEEGGNPVKMDIVIVGMDAVAVDTVGSAIIGYGIDECLYLKYCKEKKLGECDLNNIEIIGTTIDAVKRKFER